jgi:hypothetical protein
MPIRSKCLRVGFGACAALLAGILPAQPANQHDYPEEGTVISAAVDHGHVYTLETDNDILRVLCISLNPFRQTPPVCKSGSRPIAVHDKLHFRRDGDMAYMLASGSGEQRLLILSTELKILPPLPDTAALAPESGAALGLGLEARPGRQPAGATPSPTPPSATHADCLPAGPVTATPVTGGPPVEVIPTGPVSGGVVTGVPVTGGPPVTAIPVAPVSSADCTAGGGPANAPITPAPTSPGTRWVHFVRVQTAAHVYDLACRSKSCSLDHNPIQLGDLLALRVEKKLAYLSRANAGANDEQKFEILDVRSVNDPPGVPPH